jgi:hypothetical protein
VLPVLAMMSRYTRRNAMIEPVFGHTKFNRGIDRFQRRGRAAARSEWRLITATHNLLELHSHQLKASMGSNAARRGNHWTLCATATMESANAARREAS